MIFKNSTDFSDAFIRKMLRWCIKEVELPPSRVYKGFLRKANFTKCRKSYRGRAGGGAILVRIGPPERFPVNVAWRPCYRAEGMTELMLDRVACLVHITAHELAHIRLGRLGRAKNNEANADSIGRFVTATFETQREALLIAWGPMTDAPQSRVSTARPNIQEARAVKASAMFDQWAKRLKLAQSKVKKYRRKVAYYERVAATKAGAV